MVAIFYKRWHLKLDWASALRPINIGHIFYRLFHSPKNPASRQSYALKCCVI